MAQRGIPAPEKTKVTLNPNFPQPLDFLPEMVKLLKVPAGWLNRCNNNEVRRYQMNPDGYARHEAARFS